MDNKVYGITQWQMRTIRHGMYQAAIKTGKVLESYDLAVKILKSIYENNKSRVNSQFGR